VVFACIAKWCSQNTTYPEVSGKVVILFCFLNQEDPIQQLFISYLLFKVVQRISHITFNIIFTHEHYKSVWKLVG
jgi:hypothetical protein